MIDADFATPALRPSFHLNPDAIRRAAWDADRYDPIDIVAAQPVGWIDVRKIWYYRQDDARSAEPAAVRETMVRKIDEPVTARYRIGSLAGQIAVPDDFDTMFQAEIEDMFGL